MKYQECNGRLRRPVVNIGLAGLNDALPGGLTLQLGLELLGPRHVRNRVVDAGHGRPYQWTSSTSRSVLRPFAC